MDNHPPHAFRAMIMDLTVTAQCSNGALVAARGDVADLVLEPSVLPTFIPIGSRVRVLGIVPPNGYHQGGLRVQRVVNDELVGGEETWVS